jgi:XTP/dITP diphosphohydrolase
LLEENDSQVEEPKGQDQVKRSWPVEPALQRTGIAKPRFGWYCAGVTTLVIATRNTHKVAEISAILGANFPCLTLNDFSRAPRVVEDADTFAGNATKKAVELARWLAQNESGKRKAESGSIFVLADDSGLEVDALNGAPGVHSARFAVLDRIAGVSPSSATSNSPDVENNAKLLRLLRDAPPENRTARFRCVIALAAVPEGKIEVASPVCYADEFEPQTFDGVCEGRIIFAPRGENGFGYDPLFVAHGYEQTFAELGDDVKNQISHRAKALAKLRDYLGHDR